MNRPTAQSAFTLLELLTAIAMVALMVGLLIPVLSKGRRNADTAYDLNNNKQILVAMQMYAGDNDDFLPQPGLGLAAVNWASGANIPLSDNPRTAQNYAIALEKQLRSFQDGQLFSYLKNPTLLKCPSDSIIDSTFFQRNVYISSYVWNAAVVGYQTRTSSGKQPQTFHLRQFRPDAILQWEGDENRPFCFDDFSGFPDQGVSGRHDNMATVGRFDAGAQRIALNEFVSHSGKMADNYNNIGTGWRASRVPAPNLLWCNPANKGVPQQSSNP